MTKKRLFEKLRRDPENRDIAAATVTKIEILMDKYATPDAFFALGKGELQRQWHEMGNQRDLGAAFWTAFDRAIAVWKTPDVSNVPGVLGVPATPAVSAPAAEALASARFTVDELRRVADAMELLGAGSIGAMEMVDMLKIGKEEK